MARLRVRLLVAASLLLSGLTVGTMWVRGGVTCDDYFSVWLCQGGLEVQWDGADHRAQLRAQGTEPYGLWHSKWLDDTNSGAPGLRWHPRYSTTQFCSPTTGTFSVVELPLWPAAAAAVATAVWYTQKVRHRRLLGEHRCTRCAYALDGLPPGSPCPECGSRSG